MHTNLLGVISQLAKKVAAIKTCCITQYKLCKSGAVIVGTGYITRNYYSTKHFLNIKISFMLYKCPR